MAENELMFVGQKAFIEKDGKVLILKDPIYGLDFPGGRIQYGEKDLELALHREVREETGLEIEIGVPFYSWIAVYTKLNTGASKRVFITGYRCNYISGVVNLSNEHDMFFWVDKSDYLETLEKISYDERYLKPLEKFFEKL